MHRGNGPIVGIVIGLSIAVFTSLAGGCSNSGEGGRCNKLAADNGNSDCQSGLRCILDTDLVGVPQPNGTTGEGRCCPNNRAQSSVPECRLPTTPIGGSTGIPDSGEASETGTGTEPTPEAGIPDALGD